MTRSTVAHDEEPGTGQKPGPRAITPGAALGAISGGRLRAGDGVCAHGGRDGNAMACLRRADGIVPRSYLRLRKEAIARRRVGRGDRGGL